MSEFSVSPSKLPPEQEALRDGCFHPSGTFVEFPVEEIETSIPARFEKIVRQYPSRTAVKIGDQSITYDELNESANRIAHALIAERGKQPEPVALLINTGISLVASMLGILKSGKFFVLLDPSLPLTRLEINLEEAGSTIVIVDRLTIGLAQQARFDRCSVMEFEANSADSAVADVHVTIGADALFSVAYTSGSTGQPKGVCQNHRNLLHNVMLRSHESRISYLDRISLLTSGTANSVHDILFPLLNGATLLPFNLRHEGVNRLATWLTREQVSLCWLSSPLFRKLCESLNGDEKLSFLRFIRLRSDSVYKCDIDRFRDVFPPTCTLLIGLASSETGIMRALYVGRSASSHDSDAIAGYPVHGKEILLLDDKGREVGSNQIGEIVVRSRFLSPGYWRRPDLTEAKFKPDPHDPEKRLFYTGDLGLMLPDGCLIHKGRKDSRIKIRGYGVDLLEVENTLRSYTGVKDVVVVPRSENNEARLVAYYTIQMEKPPTVNELRRHLQNTLADYMTPSVFVQLEEIPLTPNGKIDRKALPDPGTTRPNLRESYVAPGTKAEQQLAGIWALSLRNDIEQKLVSIWEEVLNVRPVGVNDGFFDLGGHSLSAMQIVARACSVFRVEIPLRSLFESPTVAHMAEVIAAHRDRLPITPVERAISRRDRSIPAPLSSGQRRLWFLHQLQPDSLAYNESSARRFCGALNLAALRQATNEIVARHEVLRTTIEERDDEPVQVIAAPLPVEIPLVDLSGENQTNRWERAHGLMVETARRGFVLSREFPLRPLLLRLGAADHILLIVQHHIGSDSWSSQLFWSELTTLYGAFAAGDASPLEELPIQYQDYAEWQQRWLQGEVLERQLAYWKKQLDGVAVLELPTDHPRPATQRFNGARQSALFPKALAEGLKTLGRQEGATLFMTLLAAFQTLLCRYTGQEDVAVGCPVAGRIRPETEGLIGFFINTLVLRTDFTGEPNFRDLLRRVSTAALDAYDHQDVPFEKLVEELQPQRNLSRHPLFQVSFRLRNYPAPFVDISDLVMEPVEIDTGIAKYDLALAIDDGARGLTAEIEYNTDLFESPTIISMLGHFQALLEQMVAHPEGRVSELPILGESEKHQLLVAWNDTQRVYPIDRCLHQLFEQQVERTPDAIAVVFEDRQLTYCELNRRANQLAHHLIKHGVGREALVGLCLERSLEMVVGALAILKAGGAYVPLDPRYPAARLRFMLEDTRAAVLVTQEKFLPAFAAAGNEGRSDPTIQNVTVICLDHDWSVLERQSEANLDNQATPANLAYVIYTSGSTGRPKGVLIEHQQIVNYLYGICERYQLPPDASYAMVQPLSVDSSQTTIFPPLIFGGVLHIVSEERSLDGQTLADYFARFEIDFLKIAPSHLAALYESSSNRQRLLPRRWLIIGGESARRDWVEELRARASCALFNHYGPTEATVGMLTYPIGHEDNFPASTTVPLGKALPNTRAYLLDPHLQPVPIGVPGELYIGGRCLARGYLNLPELTAEKFVFHSFEGLAPQRLYRTGDLARYRAGGNIEFLGRADSQIKIRGFRVEPGEIEAALCEQETVQSAVITAREDHPGERQLIAYVVMRAGQTMREDALREFLKRRLPDYMVPGSFIFLGALPLTPHGKVDVRALPVPERTKLEPDEVVSVPRTPVEELLVNIWADVLQLDKVGIHDNFFELGGHSLLATRLISRVRDTFELELPLRSLFESPTVAGLASQMDLAREGEARARALPIAAEAGDHEYPLSFSQERFWFLSQLEPDDLAYKTTRGFRLRGPLDVEALERALSEIVRRHETLRTTFERHNDSLIQKISDRWSMQLSIRDLTQDAVVDGDVEIQRILDSEHRRVFDLSSDLLLRPLLVRRSAGEHVLFLSTHHIASDHWSIEVFLRELSTLYEAFANAQPSPLSELPIQYKHYAFWQRQVFQGGQLEEHLAYWKRQLAGAPPFLDLPTDHPRKPLQNRQGGRQTLVLPKGLEDALRSLGRKAGVTFFMTILAAFQTLLHRLTGENDIVVGTPVAGRDRSETESLIGLFLNTLALRTNLSGNPTFLELLTRVREVALGAYNHQELPFEKLVEELQPQRDLSRTPFFQVFINMYNFKEASLELDRLTVTSLNRSTALTPQFDLEFFIRQRDDEVQCAFVYDADLFESATIARLLAHFQVLLEGIAADPWRRISDLPILTEAEKQQLLVEWNETERDYPKDKCVHQLFDEQVERTPEAVAVVFEERQLTYRELNRRANRLAHYLEKLGVGPEVLVGICVERSLEMIVGLLGILKAGAAYVPLDPQYPKERLTFMLEDAKVEVLLVQQGVVTELTEQQARVVDLDRDGWEIVQESEENPDSQATGENLAYVIYTSGSTGIPKGVMIPHRGLVNYLSWATEAYGVAAGQGAPVHSSIGFDLTITSLFTPLLAGRPVELLAEQGDVEALSSRLRKESDYSLIKITPAHLELMGQELSADSLAHRTRALVIGGEALTFEKLDLLSAHLPKIRLINEYGPTETVVGCCVYEVAPGSYRSGPVPIGRPIANTQIYILDPHLNPVPIGIVGEIHIGGDGLARGYVNRPEATQEQFIVNPFSRDPDSRLYKTGDLGRYLPDGNIEFLGRIDNQVKVRGYRIELGEIEVVLGQHPTVQSSVVVVREDTPGDQRLVAYVVGEQGESFDAAGIRKYLDQKLPAYMIPSVFVLLDELPLTPNRKVDRKALPVPDRDRPEGENIYQAPRTPVEDALASLWRELLKMDKVGIQDNFFELGGHSLLAAQLTARIRNTLGVELPLRRLFECPTIYGLAEAISAKRQTSQTRQFLPIAPASRDGDLPLSFAQQRLWFIDQLEPESSTYNVPGAWRLSGSLDFMALQRSVNEIVRRHEVLRTSFFAVDGQPAQHIRPPESLSLDIVHLAELANGERESAIELHVREESRRPFDLARGPLLRAKLLRLAEDDHVLLFTMHHIVSDGWSVGVLFRELSRLYEAFSGDSASPLKDLPIQYADYAVWQRGWLRGEVLESQLAYWRRQLENLTVLELPTDRRRPGVRRYRGARARVNFDATLIKKLWDLSRSENGTLYMTLLAAFQILLSRYSGQEDIAVGSPIAGRSIPELEGLIGFFANTLVLRGDLSSNPTFREFLQRTRDVALEAYAHQDLPFEKLVEDLRPRRDLNISPLFQVMLVMQNDRREDLDFKGLTTTSVSIDSETAKFDLLLSLREHQLGLRATLEYDTDLFDSITIDRMLAHFETLLRGIIANPDQRLLQLPLLTDRERHQLLAEWNETTQEYPKHLCVHELFERQAETRPNEIAIVFEDRQVTYRELDIDSNQLAHYLRRQGIRSESIVGVCLERSPEMIVAVLAILKAGGAYLPLDPSYPSERLGFMAEQAHASIILTQKNLVSRIPAGEAVRHCLDSLDQLLALEKQERLSGSASPDNAAYALFTSGSTGVPKGVLMEHRPLVNLLSWQAENFASAAARTLQFASLSFDVSFQEIFSALCFGGSLVMIGEAERRDARALWPLLKEKAVERMFLPFIALQQFADAAQDDAMAIESLREIITAGEQLQITQPIVNLFTRLPACHFFNQYGPTESHVVTSFTLEGDPANWPDLPPIGRPVANSKIYILDQCLQPLPAGVIGELYIGGDTLAREYLNHPDLNREQFISNPFIKEPRARLYRTGDLARYVADGTIQFVGRIDDQVKVRGFRVEPAEIETLLSRHPAVLECAISVREEAGGGKRLVAYIVASPDHDFDSAKVRNFLQEKLPEYMIPSAFVFLESLPLTNNGKIDRRALPAPDGSRPELAKAYTAPRNPTEESLAKIWRQVLKLEKVGVDDNFFDLGGHSLLATQVISRVRNVFSVEVPLRRMFDAPTIAEMVTIITENQVKGASVPPLARIPREIDSMTEEDAERSIEEIESTIAK